MCTEYLFFLLFPSIGYAIRVRILILGTGPASTQVIHTLTETLSSSNTAEIAVLTYDHGENQQFIHAHESPKSDSLRPFYFQTPKVASLSIKSSDEIWGSFNLGGWGNVWGATLSEEPDAITSQIDLMSLFGEFRLADHPERKLAKFLAERRVHSTEQNIYESIRVSPLAIASLSADINTGCNQCGECLSGCPKNHIWNPARSILKYSKILNFEILFGFATKIVPTDKSIKIHYLAQDNPEKVCVIEADLVIIGLGAIQTACLLLRSGLIPNETRIRDSQMMLVPFIRNDLRAVGGFEARIALSEAVTAGRLEINSIRGDFFSQLYGYSISLDRAISNEFPILKLLPKILRRHILKFFGIAMVFLSEEFSGELELIVNKQGVISQIPIPSSTPIKKIKSELRKDFLKKGLLLITPFTKFLPVGKGYHLGNVFRGKTNSFDFEKGSLLLNPKIFIVDGASLNRISSFPITIRIMKNAQRITRHLVKHLKL